MKLDWKGILLWSNQFYGICAVLLAIESNVLLLHTMPNVFLLLFIHLATVLYYTHAYLKEDQDGIYNERSKWYQKHQYYLKIRQVFYTIACAWLIVVKLDAVRLFIHAALMIQITLLASVAISAIYYLPNYPFFPFKSFRNKGILKSAGIAWIWTILCCMAPIWFSTSANFTEMLSSFPFWAHFIQLYFFILILAILFDIKDLYRDKEAFVNTLVVKHGVDFTIHKIVLPLLLFRFLFTLVGHYWQGGGYMHLLSRLLILILIYIVSRIIVRQKAIHINMLLIDGLMIIKAILSIGVVWLIH